MSGVALEWTAALFSILGVWLMAKRRLAAWPVGLLSVALYGAVFAEAKLSTPGNVVESLSILTNISLMQDQDSKKQYFNELVKQAVLTEQQQLQLIASTSTIQSDYELTELMLLLAQAQSMQPQVQKALLQTSMRINSDYEKRRLLSQLAQPPSGFQLVQILQASLEIAMGTRDLAARTESAAAALSARLQDAVASASPGNRSCAISNRSPLQDTSADAVQQLGGEGAHRLVDPSGALRVRHADVEADHGVVGHHVEGAAAGDLGHIDADSLALAVQAACAATSALRSASGRAP